MCKEVFRRQIALAKEVNLPIIIHNRDATEDVVTILKKKERQKSEELCTALLAASKLQKRVWK